MVSTMCVWRVCIGVLEANRALLLTSIKYYFLRNKIINADLMIFDCYDPNDFI